MLDEAPIVAASNSVSSGGGEKLQTYRMLETFKKHSGSNLLP